MRRNRSEPMPVKHWSAAGLMLTTWCNARCSSCYVCAGPHRADWVTPADALRWWGQLEQASPHGCRVHLAGGEPFGRWPLLREILLRARAAGLSPLEKVETNAYWAVEDDIIRDRLTVLCDAGVGTLVISADPYHQQFVPLSRVRRLADAARQILGPGGVRVRFQDWLDAGQDTAELSADQRDALFAGYAGQGRERFNGRAAQELAPRHADTPPAELAGRNCRHELLRSKHVHVWPDGRVIPGVCGGIVLGRLERDRSVGDVWRALDADHAGRPVVGTLAEGGPVALAREAQAAGFAMPAKVASKCHLCWTVRGFLASRGLHDMELGPAWVYGEAGKRGKTARTDPAEVSQ